MREVKRDKSENIGASSATVKYTFGTLDLAESLNICRDFCADLANKEPLSYFDLFVFFPKHRIQNISVEFLIYETACSFVSR